ncbi:MAG TPA: hypothetical protein VG937_13805 [Polyangiaceae bacterium]|nr:hypothetical protein [Polyangiaceae bacterium]
MHLASKACCCLLFVSLFSGCASAAPEGKVCALPAAPNEAVGGVIRVDAGDADGLRVLWQGPSPVHKPNAPSAAWAAASRPQLEALWKQLGRPAPAPEVDFVRDVVFGVSDEGGICSGKIHGAAIEPSGVIWIRGMPANYGCVDRPTRVAQVVALPRRLLPESVVLVPFEIHRAYAFAVPELPPPPALAH